MDGKVTGSEKYAVSEGSTIVELKSSYLETLSLGIHSIGIVSETGTASFKFEVVSKSGESEENPETGAGAPFSTAAAILLAAAAIVASGKKK